MASNLAGIKQLRERTAASFQDCGKALVACNDDLERAAAWLREEAVRRIVEASGAPREDAEIGFGLFGWNLEQAANHASQRVLFANPSVARGVDLILSKRLVGPGDRNHWNVVGETG